MNMFRVIKYVLMGRLNILCCSLPITAVAVMKETIITEACRQAQPPQLLELPGIRRL